MSDSFLAQYSELRKLGASELAEIWQHYDRDGSGYIEAGPELERLLTDMLRAAGEELSELKIRDFIDGVLEMFDVNRSGAEASVLAGVRGGRRVPAVNSDGKLSRAELEQLLQSE